MAFAEKGSFLVTIQGYGKSLAEIGNNRFERSGDVISVAL